MSDNISTDSNDGNDRVDSPRAELYAALSDALVRANIGQADESDINNLIAALREHGYKITRVA